MAFRQIPTSPTSTPESRLLTDVCETLFGNLGATELASRLDPPVTPATVLRWMSGETTPRSDVWSQLVNALEDHSAQCNQLANQIDEIQWPKTRAQMLEELREYIE